MFKGNWADESDMLTPLRSAVSYLERMEGQPEKWPGMRVHNAVQSLLAFNHLNRCAIRSPVRTDDPFSLTRTVDSFAEVKRFLARNNFDEVYRGTFHKLELQLDPTKRGWLDEYNFKLSQQAYYRICVAGRGNHVYGPKDILVIAEVQPGRSVTVNAHFELRLPSPLRKTNNLPPLERAILEQAFLPHGLFTSVICEGVADTIIAKVGINGLDHVLNGMELLAEAHGGTITNNPWEYFGLHQFGDTARAIKDLPDDIQKMLGVHTHRKAEYMFELGTRYRAS